MAKCFWINSNALIYMEQLANEAENVETGGILMGYIGKNEEAVVTMAIGPGINATHSRHYFIPDDDYHKEAMDKIYNESDGNITYLGDWHSHPEGGAALSLKDRITLGRIGNVHSPYGRLPFMLVLAREGKAWKLAPFQLSALRFFSFIPARIEHLKAEVFNA